jgi:hypothetical protein
MPDTFIIQTIQQEIPHEKKVFDICDHLAAQGIKPTLVRVRDELGGGSFSSINPLVKQWKEEQRVGDDPAMQALHTAIVAIGQKAATSIWKAADNHYQKLRKEQQAELKFLHKKTAKAETTINTLRDELYLVKSELERVKVEKQKLERMLIFHPPVVSKSASQNYEDIWQTTSYQINLHWSVIRDITEDHAD